MVLMRIRNQIIDLEAIERIDLDAMTGIGTKLNRVTLHFKSGEKTYFEGKEATALREYFNASNDILILGIDEAK